MTISLPPHPPPPYWTHPQFITMGSGTEKWEEIAADLDDRFPGQFKAVLSFKGQEKYRTYAAADFAMMPSRLVCVCVCVCVCIFVLVIVCGGVGLSRRGV